ncbi:MAG: TetR/AcrR family transcriptional regulator [Victivallaceae bacterium]
MPKYPEKIRDLISGTVRANILHAGIGLIREAGWSAFTTERIAERAGVSRGVLYNYFANKEAIARSILDASLREQNRQLAELAARTGPASGKLRAMAAFLLEDFLDQRELHHIVIAHLPPPGHAGTPPPVELLNERDAIFGGVLAEGNRNGEFAVADPAAAVLLLRGGLHELCMRSFFDGRTPEIRPLIDIFLKGIGC